MIISFLVNIGVSVISTIPKTNLQYCKNKPNIAKSVNAFDPD